MSHTLSHKAAQAPLPHAQVRTRQRMPDTPAKTEAAYMLMKFHACDRFCLLFLFYLSDEVIHIYTQEQLYKVFTSYVYKWCCLQVMGVNSHSPLPETERPLRHCVCWGILCCQLHLLSDNLCRLDCVPIYSIRGEYKSHRP